MFKQAIKYNISIVITLLLVLITLYQHEFHAASAWTVLLFVEFARVWEAQYRENLKKQIELLQTTLARVSRDELKAEIVKRDGKSYIKISPMPE